MSLQTFASVNVDVAEFFIVKACSLVGGTVGCISCRWGSTCKSVRGYSPEGNLNLLSLPAGVNLYDVTLTSLSVLSSLTS